MKIKDIIKNTAMLLANEKVCTYLTNGSGSSSIVLADVDLLTRLANLVISELSSTYVNMIKTERVQTVNGRVDFADLDDILLKVISVKDVNGFELSYKKNYDGLNVNESVVDIEYSYKPSSYGLEDTIGYTDKDVPESVLAFGVAAEYSIVVNRFDEAVMWHNRFMDGISALYMPKSVQTASRRFV